MPESTPPSKTCVIHALPAAGAALPRTGTRLASGEAHDMPTKHYPKETTIRIAIPAADGQLHGHFGGCPEFAIIDAEAQRRMVFNMQFVPAPPHQPGRLPLWLREQGVQVVIAGGIGRRALDLFAHHGIRVHAGRAGGSIEELAVDYLEGRLVAGPEACEHHPHHQHGDHHHCSDQGGH